MQTEEQKQRLAKWRSIVAEYIKSGLTQKSFCDQQGISLSQLVYYHGMFKKEEIKVSKGDFVPVKLSGIEIEKATVAGEIKIILPNRLQCIFSGHRDVKEIKCIVAMLLSC